MRDWNIHYSTQVVNHLIGFQHTYEGLKLVELNVRFFNAKVFSAYLWGIETILEMKYINGGNSVFSIPMRDWNNKYGSKKRTSNFPVFSIPMRDWNFSAFEEENKRKNCFQHTYEGLKPRYLRPQAPLQANRFQHTYEGLKPRHLRPQSPLQANVFSIPMRDWNTGKTFPGHSYFWVFSIPMRDWNNKNPHPSIGAGDVFSIPMRDWNAAYLPAICSGI